MNKKIGLVSLGCPKNLVDSEIMLGNLKDAGYEITYEKEDAEVLIVNTCGFIESAKKESIDTILEMAQCKEKKCKILIVTGCLAERYRDEIMKEIPEVDAVIGTGSYSQIEEVLRKAFRGEKTLTCERNDSVAYLENKRLLSTGKGYAYIKVAEGCDNCCTYCIIPKLRGHYRSRKMEDILHEAKRLAKEGIKEVILVAQDTTRYGVDLYKEHKISELVREISRIDGIEWIRLLYCYPEEIDDALISELKSNDKLCKYLDIPIQHASDRILKMMGRRGSIREVEKLLRRLKSEITGITLRSTVIVGFPGEEEEDYRKLVQFVGDAGFDRLGVFSYSREEGTAAAKMKPQIPKKVKELRRRGIMELQESISRQNNEKRIGRVYKTLVEGVAEDGIFYYGRTYAEAPEIDGIVYFTSHEPLETGVFVQVKILNAEVHDLIGEVIYESAE